MANFKRNRAKHQRAGCLFCYPFKDERGGNSHHVQTRQEQRQRTAERVDPERIDPRRTETDLWYEPNTPKCAYCQGPVCTYEECSDHTEDCELDDGRWTCSRVCYDAIVVPLDPLCDF